MIFHPGQVLYFQEYVFNDTGEVKPHYGLVIIKPELTKFKESIYCAVITSQKPKMMWHTHCLDCEKYKPNLIKTSYIRLRYLDYVPKKGLSSKVKQPICTLLDIDYKKTFKLLKSVIFTEPAPVDKYLRATILREWKKQLKTYDPAVT